MEILVGLLVVLVVVGIVGYTIKAIIKFFWLLISSPTVWLILIIIALSIPYFS
jgi:hypothetical protein